MIARVLWLGLVFAAGVSARAVDLPPSCASAGGSADATTPLDDLWKKEEASVETDPTAAFQLACATLPRVARERGGDSLDSARWRMALATVLIAYRDEFAEAEPLLASAQPIFVKALGPNAAEVAETHVAHAWINFRRGKLADSKADWEKALAIREKTPGERKIELQKALVGLGQAQMALRDFPGARVSLERAYGILEENGETVSEAASAIENALTNLFFREEDYPLARQHAESQIRIESAMKGGAAQLVPAHVMLGTILERLDRFDESEATLREALRLADAPDATLQRHTLAALTQLVNLLNARGRPQDALPLGERAIAVGEKSLGPDAPKMVRVLQVVGETEHRLGDLPKALATHERGAAIVEKKPEDVERQTRVAIYRGLGRVQMSLGETEAAAATFAVALQAAGDDANLATERAAVLVALAETARGADDGAARAHLEEALTLYRSRLPETHPRILEVLVGLCDLEVDAGALPAPSCDEVARRLETTPEAEPALRAAAFSSLSRLAERRGDAVRAEGLAVRELAVAASAGTPDPSWRASYHVARLVRAREQGALAVFFGRNAIAEIERQREHFAGDDRRFERGFLADKAAVYRAVADWLMEEGRIEEGLSVLRLLKSEELYDFTMRGDAFAPAGRNTSPQETDPALWSRYLEALDTDAAKSEELLRLTRLRDASRITADEREKLTRLLASERSGEEARAARLAQFISAGAGAAGKPAEAPRTVKVDALEREMRRFGPDSVLAVYLFAEHHLRVLVATRRQQFEIQVPVEAGDLRKRIGAFLDRIDRREDVAAESLRLYDTLAKPVDEAAQRAHATRLVLWLDGSLRYVPFAALSDGKRYLVDKYALQSYAADEGLAAAPEGSGVRGFGVTKAVAGFAPLPGVADELCSIVRGPIHGLAADPAHCASPDESDGVLAGEGFADAEFTEARLDAELSAPARISVLHLGTHFSLRPGNAMRSFLVLGDGSHLPLDRIASLDFRGIDLLTLSACQTGAGGAVSEDGREVEGLGSIVRRRGAAHVVSSLWQVEDASTAALMRTMYRTLGGPRGDVAKALQKAQISLRSTARGGTRPYEHPYYWAGFSMTGSAPK